MVELQEFKFAVPSLDGGWDHVVGLPVQLAGVGREGEAEQRESYHRVENYRGQPGRVQSGRPEGRHHRPDQTQQPQDSPGRDAVREEEVELSPGEGEVGVDTEVGPGHSEAHSLSWREQLQSEEEDGGGLTNEPAQTQTDPQMCETPAAVEDRVRESVSRDLGCSRMVITETTQSNHSVTCYPGVFGQADTEPDVENVEEVVVPTEHDDDHQEDLTGEGQFSQGSGWSKEEEGERNLYDEC